MPYRHSPHPVAMDRNGLRIATGCSNDLTRTTMAFCRPVKGRPCDNNLPIDRVDQEAPGISTVPGKAGNSFRDRDSVRAVPECMVLKAVGQGDPVDQAKVDSNGKAAAHVRVAPE